MIDNFKGEYSFLSNFHPSPIEFEGTVFPTAEHLYQACKFEDDTVFFAIASLPTPGMAKKFGRTANLSPNWNAERVVFMAAVLVEKFRQNPDLVDLLLATGDEELVEGNWWGDTFWGVCKGVGENQLGKMLMDLRKFHSEARS